MWILAVFIKLITKPDYIRKLVLHNATIIIEREKNPYCDAAGTVYLTSYIDLPYTSIGAKYSSSEHHFLFDLVNGFGKRVDQRYKKYWAHTTDNWLISRLKTD